MEKSFFSLVQKLGLIFALISFTMVVFLGWFGYEKISSQATDDINTPIISLAKYQNPISLQVDNVKSQQSIGNTKKNTQILFDQEFDAYIEQIMTNLQMLPHQTVESSDAQFQTKVMIKIKAIVYVPALKLSYVKSLSKLTRQLVNVGGNQVNIDEFLHWYDQEFARQVELQTQQNLIKMGTAKSDQMTGFISLAMMGAALGFFIMFVMMLAMLRIEKNTRT